MNRATEQLTDGRTTLVVAHRLATAARAARAARIVVMESGKIAEVGTHAELLGRGAATRPCGPHSPRMPNSLPDQVRPASPLCSQSVPAHAGLASARSRLIQRPGDDERRALGRPLPVVERLTRDLTGGRP